MEVHANEILIYYNPNSSAHRKTIAHAQAISKNIRTHPFENGPSSGRLWRNIIQRLDMPPKQLLNKADDYYQKHIRGREFDSESWLKILIQNTWLIKFPIALQGKKAVFCVNETDIYRLQQVPASY